MNKIRFDRLRKLADHLLHGQLGHKFFDFSRVNAYNFDENGCGAKGCAIGECPIAFPDEWKFNNEYEPILKSLESEKSEIGYVDVCESGMAFFGISEREFNELFVPTTSPQVTEIYLRIDATKEQVANRILKFCDIKEKENE